MNSRTLQKRQERDRAVRQSILDSAVPLIQKEGYGNLTIKDICDNAGVTTGAFYRHFKSKDDLISFAYIGMVDKAIEGVAPKLEGLSLPNQLVALWCEFIACNKALGRESVFVFLNETNPECDSQVSRGRMTGATARLVQDAVDGGFRLSPGRDPQKVSDDIVVLSTGVVYDWYSMRGSFDPVERIRSLLGRVVGSLL